MNLYEAINPYICLKVILLQHRCIVHSLSSFYFLFLFCFGFCLEIWRKCLYYSLFAAVMVCLSNYDINLGMLKIDYTENTSFITLAFFQEYNEEATRLKKKFRKEFPNLPEQTPRRRRGRVPKAASLDDASGQSPKLPTTSTQVCNLRKYTMKF